jgi:HPt (histidine-containing phosphotransfer) domain-containing protein
MDPFDRQAVLNRFGGDIELLRQIADLFRGSAGPWLDEVREAFAAGDLPRVKRVAHTLKGSAANFLATKAQEAAFQVQQLAAAGNTASLPDGIAQLEGEVARLISALDAMLASTARETP